MSNACSIPAKVWSVGMARTFAGSHSRCSTTGSTHQIGARSSFQRYRRFAAMHTRTLRLLSLVGVAAALTAAEAGCSQQAAPPKATHTVDQYLAKPDLMEAKVRECANNPGELRNDPDCVNV